jgi:hypothetical protein
MSLEKDITEIKGLIEMARPLGTNIPGSKTKVKCAFCGREKDAWTKGYDPDKKYFCSPEHRALFQKGKSYEERYGSDKSKEVKKNLSVGHQNRDSESYKRQGQTLSAHRKEHGGLNHDSTCPCFICKAKRGEQKGENNPFFGKCHSKELLQQMARKNHQRYVDGTHPLCNPIKQQARVTASTKSLMKRPTSYEDKIQKVITEYGLPYRYTGDGTFWLTSYGKHINPDFISTDWRKVALETYNTSQKTYTHGSVEIYKTERTRLFNNLGWKVVFFDENDLRRLDWKEYCVSKIIKEDTK